MSLLRTLHRPLTAALFAHCMFPVREADLIVVLNDRQVAVQGSFSSASPTIDHFHDLMSEEPLTCAFNAARNAR